MLEKGKDPLGGRLLFAFLIFNSTCILLLHAAAFPDWTDCPAVCSCKWKSGKKSALCSDAGLTSLPASLDPDMQVLDLSGNKIPGLQSEIFKRAGLVNLQKVYLRNAGIYDIHTDAFKDMRILIEVDLSDNHIVNLDINTFFGNERLRILTLSGNPLLTIKSHQFPNLQHLRTLELQKCSINYIDELAFINLSGLESLKLDGNQLEYIESNTISTLINLKTLTLDNNKWSCDCRLKNLRKWLVPKTTLYSVSQICSSPAKFIGRHWEDIKINEFACPPKVKLYANTIQEDVNGNLSISCNVFGDPIPELWWLFNGELLNSTKPELSSNSFVLTTSSSSISSNNKLLNNSSNNFNNKIPQRWSNITIYNASDSDAGEYTCHAKNIADIAKDTINIVVPRVFTAPTLSQTDNWLIWISLAGAGATILCVFVTIIFITFCFCNGTRKRNKREKIKLENSASFGDQEKKLLDLSVTTTTTTSSTNQPANNTNNNFNCHQTLSSSTSDRYSPNNGDLELGDHSSSICDAATVTIERLRPSIDNNCELPSTIRNLQCTTVEFPPPPPEFTGGVLPSGIFGNIFISVALPQDVERCYPDLLDIPVHAPSIVDKYSTSSMISSFATLPRRPRTTDSASSTHYDNMGPRVTATGSSTFSLTDDLRLSPPPPPRSLIKPPIEFVSL